MTSNPRTNDAARRQRLVILRAVTLALWALLGLRLAVAAVVKESGKPANSLDAFLANARQQTQPTLKTPGSLWDASSALAGAALDTRARRANDLILIRIVEETRAEAAGSVQSKRSMDASSGVSALFGALGERSGLRSLLSPSSDSNLTGQAQTASSTLLTTTLAGHVLEVLPNGLMLVEAARSVEMNNEVQTVRVRGIVRTEDVGADNTVYSSAVSHLEVELKGKGVISDGVRPPNKVVRIIMKVLGF